jgi:hypothetical protein
MKKLLFVLVFVSLGIGAGGQENQSPGSLADLNVNFMMRGYFYAGSIIKDQQALGGFGTSRNFPKAIDPGIGVRKGEISLIAESGAVGRDYILKHYHEYGGPQPPGIDHEGINDAYVEKGSAVHYYYLGKWLELQGAD